MNKYHFPFAMIAVATALSTLVADDASAGTKLDVGYRVFINSSSRWVQGSIGSTRNSTNAFEYIGCSVYVNDPFSGTFAECIARDSSSNFGACQTTDPTMMQAIESLHGDSFLYFTYDANGTCTALRIDSFSYWEPKNP